MLATDFKEVGNILRKACPIVKDFIILHELIPYLDAFLSPGTIQQIKADIKNHGEVNSCQDFFGYIGKRPSYFPKFVAALHKTKQDEVYMKILEEIKSYFANNPKRLQEVQEMIKKEIDDANCNVSNSDEPVESFPEASGNSLVKPEALTPQTNHRTAEFANTRPLQTPNSSVDPNFSKGNKQESTQAIEKTGADCHFSHLTLLPSNNTITTATDVRTNQPLVTTVAVPYNGQVQTLVNYIPPSYRSQEKFESMDTPGSVDSGNSLAASKLSKSLPSIDNIGVDDVHTNQLPVTTVAVGDNRQVQTPDIPISKLKANVFNNLAKLLLKMSTHDTSEAWWEYIVHNEDIGLSRDDEHAISSDVKPGRKFLDMLNLKGFTLSFLKYLFEKYGIVEALEIFNQNEVAVPNPRHLQKPAEAQKLDNNINKATDKEVPYKNMNIPVSSNKDQPSTIQSPKSGTNNTWLNDDALESSTCSKNSFNTEDSLSSRFTDVSIADTPIKGTQAIQAVGDKENKNSTPSHDQDVVQFQNDVAKNAEVRLESFNRIHQGDVSLRLDNAQLVASSGNTLQKCQNTPSDDQDEAQFHKDIAKNTEFRLQSFNKIHQGDDCVRFENAQLELAYGNISQAFHNTCSIDESSLGSTSNIDSMDSNNS